MDKHLHLPREFYRPCHRLLHTWSHVLFQRTNSAHIGHRKRIVAEIRKGSAAAGCFERIGLIGRMRLKNADKFM
jgi:hypothetical protein